VGDVPAEEEGVPVEGTVVGVGVAVGVAVDVGVAELEPPLAVWTAR
jgi:hypothetical protein